jgi:RNA recognition motif-containing protein
MIRLFVGGLPPDIDEGELAKRFSSFGVVTACEYAKSKPEGVKEFEPICRGFAYLNIEPVNDAAIRKCLTAVSVLLN